MKFKLTCDIHSTFSCPESHEYLYRDPIFCLKQTNSYPLGEIVNRGSQDRVSPSSGLLMTSHLEFESLSLTNMNAPGDAKWKVAVYSNTLSCALCLSLRMILHGGKNMYSLCFIPLEAWSSQGFKDLPKVSQLLNEGKMLKSVWGPGRFHCLPHFHYWMHCYCEGIEVRAVMWITVYEMTSEFTKWRDPSRGPQSQSLEAESEVDSGELSS